MKRIISVFCLLSILGLIAIGATSGTSTAGTVSTDQLPSLPGCWQLNNGPGDPWVVKFNAPKTPNVYVGHYVSPAAAIPPVNRFEAHVMTNDGGTIFVPMIFTGLTPGIGVGAAADYMATFSGKYDAGAGAITGTWSFIRGAGGNGGGAGVKGSGDFTLTKLAKCP
jgi:hypothetical protein